MLTLKDYAYDSARQLNERLIEAIDGCETVEAAAQGVAETICAEFGDEIPLARVYLTVPFKKLPPEVAAFAQGVATGVAKTALPAETPVLSLLGTYGTLPPWRDRHQSKGHAGIPLLSAEFVHEIPMIASLLQQLGIDMQLPPRDGIAALGQSTSAYYGSFFVEDARTAADAMGRKIIPAQDFVAKHGIVSVLGSGAVHLATGSLLVLILFTRCGVGEREVSRISPVASRVLGKISPLLTAERLFSGA